MTEPDPAMVRLSAIRGSFPARQAAAKAEWKRWLYWRAIDAERKSKPADNVLPMRKAG